MLEYVICPKHTRHQHWPLIGSLHLLYRDRCQVDNCKCLLPNMIYDYANHIRFFWIFLWKAAANQRPVFKSCDLFGPMRARQITRRHNLDNGQCRASCKYLAVFTLIIINWIRGSAKNKKYRYCYCWRAFSIILIQTM